MTALATLDQLEIRLGLDPHTLSGTDKARAEAALADATALVRAEAQRDFVDDLGVADAPEAIVRVVLGAALRNYRNPDAETQHTVGPFSRTVKATDTGVYLTDAEREIVRRYRPRTHGGLWTLSTTRDEATSDTAWVWDQYGTEPFPIGSVSEPWK